MEPFLSKIWGVLQVSTWWHYDNPGSWIVLLKPQCWIPNISRCLYEGNISKTRSLSKTFPSHKKEVCTFHKQSDFPLQNTWTIWHTLWHNDNNYHFKGVEAFTVPEVWTRNLAYQEDSSVRPNLNTIPLCRKKGGEKEEKKKERKKCLVTWLWNCIKQTLHAL